VKQTPKLAIITVRGAGYHPTGRLIQAADQRGLLAVAVDPYTVCPGIEKGKPLLDGPGGRGLPDIVMPRQGAEIKGRCLPLIAHFEAMGATVINSLAAVVLARHQFLTLQALCAAGCPVPDTRFVNSPKTYATALDGFGAAGAVVKPVSGRQGTDVFRVGAGQGLPESLEAHLSRGRGVIVQQFIDPGRRKDIRALVIGESVAAAMALRPEPGDFRANFHLTGYARPIVLSRELAALACRAAAAIGLEIAGIDLMIDAQDRPLVIEANYAPGFQGLEQATGLDIAGKMIDHALSRYHAQSSQNLNVRETQR
jgi:ribosomal protein S6--L-glutamate ligase